MNDDAQMLPEDLKQLAHGLDRARRASIAEHGAGRIEIDAAQAGRNFETAMREAPEYEEVARQFYAMLVAERLYPGGRAREKIALAARKPRGRHHSMAEVPEGLRLDEYRMRQAYYARIASRLPTGSEEKRSALEQVRLTQRTIDGLRQRGPDRS